MQYQLRISGFHHEIIYSHLFPGDKKEAVAIVLCGQFVTTDLNILLVKEIFPIPYEECLREEDYVSWKTEGITHLLEKANEENLSVLKIHSHPGRYSRFSETDNNSDRLLFPSIYGWMDHDQLHGSSVMLPDGEIFGRIVTDEAQFIPMNKILVSGNEIKIWSSKDAVEIQTDIKIRNRQTFGEGTTNALQQMKVGVVGASGTGSPTIEQLVRLGVGHVVLIDPDKVELKNLNRILNTKIDDAKKGKFKVDVITTFIKEIGFDTVVSTHAVNLYDSREAIIDLIKCDVIFGCVDSVDGRHLLNQISTFYLLPYFDLGVKIEADGAGGIEQINGAVHYIQPGGSSLLSRGAYTLQRLEAESLKRIAPDEYERRRAEKYIVNVPVDRPAVISINLQVSSTAINEFLDRIHRFKISLPSERAITWISITEGQTYYEEDGEPDKYLYTRVGRGDCKPFLEMTNL